MGVVENFPSISPAEFEAGCKEIERRCVNALEATGLLSIKWIEEELLIKQQRKVNLQHRDEDHDVPALPPEVDQDDIQDFDDEQMVSAIMCICKSIVLIGFILFRSIGHQIATATIM